jgi:hypothetical protein
VAALRAWIDAAGITEGALFRRVFNKKAQRITDQRLHGRCIASIVKKGARLGSASTWRPLVHTACGLASSHQL